MINLLLLNCYEERNKDQIKPYLSWIHSISHKSLNVALLIEDHLPQSFDQFDSVIISGAKRMISHRQYNPALLDLMAGNQRPLLGICYGHQLLATAFGCDVQKDNHFHEGKEEIRKLGDVDLVKGFPQRFVMEESHREYVVRNEKLDKWFSVLADNQKNQVEIIKHCFLPVYGVQFHPEKSRKWGQILLENFIKLKTGHC
jgi:GMP synthase-like glutamine amidotransferase